MSKYILIKSENVFGTFMSNGGHPEIILKHLKISVEHLRTIDIILRTTENPSQFEEDFNTRTKRWDEVDWDRLSQSRPIPTSHNRGNKCLTSDKIFELMLL